MDKFLTKFSKQNVDVTQQQQEEGTSCLNASSDSSDSSNDEIMELQLGVDVKGKKKKNYKQKFRNEWLTKFSWVENNNNETFCKVCKVRIIGGAFHLNRHEMGPSHIRKMNRAKKTPSISKVFEKQSSQTTFANKVETAEIKLAAFLSQENLPFRLMDKLVEVLPIIFHDSDIAKSIKMKRKKATQITLGVIAPEAKNEVIHCLKTTRFSLIIDETTDVSTQKSLVVIARYFQNDVFKDRFFELIEVDSGTAESLFLSVKSLLDKNQIPYKNLIGFSADNASVMMGEYNGVQRRLRDICPDIVVHGCSCHSLHLCASNASKKLPNSVEQFCRDIYSHFANSSKRIDELKECQIFANEKPSQMLYPSQTRWLSVKAVSDRILQHWNSLTLYFQRSALEDNLSNSKFICNALHNIIYKLYLHFLSYALELVTRINIEFQSEDSKLPFLLERITTLYKTLIKSFIKRDIINKTCNINDIIVTDPNNFLKIENMYFGAHVDSILCDTGITSKIDKTELHNFKLRCLDFYIELCKQIKKRFDFQNPHLQFASLFSPKIALSGDILSIAKFKILYPNLDIDIELVNLEWQLLSETFNNTDFESMNLLQFWMKVKYTKNSLGDGLFRNLIEVVQYVLTLPHSSAAAERVFSQLFIIKSKLRNRLKITTCSAILSVKDMLAQKSFSLKNWQPKKQGMGNVDLIDVEEI